MRAVMIRPPRGRTGLQIWRIRYARSAVENALPDTCLTVTSPPAEHLYGGRRSPEVLVRSGEWALIRPRVTAEQLIALDRLPGWF